MERLLLIWKSTDRSTSGPNKFVVTGTFRHPVISGTCFSEQITFIELVLKWSPLMSDRCRFLNIFIVPVVSSNWLWIIYNLEIPTHTNEESGHGWLKDAPVLILPLFLVFKILIFTRRTSVWHIFVGSGPLKTSCKCVTVLANVVTRLFQVWRKVVITGVVATRFGRCVGDEINSPFFPCRYEAGYELELFNLLEGMHDHADSVRDKPHWDYLGTSQ